MTHASVFSGIGAPEVAADLLGWKNLFHCEINPFGRRVLDYWFPNSKSYEDIKNTDFSEWRGKVNVLTGGFPCQPFSYAGQRRGAKDDRYLWPYMFRCIGQIQPDWVVAENVAGILTMVEQGDVSEVASSADLFDSLNDIRGYRLRETFTLQRICDDLESHGYSVQPMLIPACAVGAPHRRDRVFIIGNRNATDTDSEMLEGRQRSGAQGHGQSSDGSVRHVCGNADVPGARWQGFPTVSPVHRGNDGIPFDVDCLAIPFGKWRTESIKAYGNAIVPQVMYEIFRAIEIVENQ